MSDLTERINEALDGLTPGPWTCINDMLVKRGLMDGMKVIVETPDGWFVVGPSDVVAAHDVARLIAAAPALLREAAEQLAAKDAEIERLRWAAVEDVLSMPLKYRPQDVAAELRAQWGFA